MGSVCESFELDRVCRTGWERLNTEFVQEVSHLRRRFRGWVAGVPC